MRKRNLWKRLVAGAAAIMLVGTMGITAMAGGGSYDATEDEGTITVHKFGKTTAATIPNLTGEELASTSGLGTPLSGVGFTLYKLTMPTPPTGKTFTNTYTTSYDDITGLVDGVTMTFTDATTGAATVAMVGAEAFTNTSGVIEFGAATPLAKGHYLLVESTTPTGYTPVNPTIVSLPLTNAAGDGYIYDVHVYPKNISDTPITKVLDDPTLTYIVGDKVDFTINAAFKNDESSPNDVTSVEDLKIDPNYGEMEIRDTLVGGLVYDSSVISALLPGGVKRALLPAEYTLAGTATGELVWALTPAGIDALYDLGALSLEVKLKATVKASNDALTNMASSYVKRAGSTDEPEVIVTPGVVVPTGTINITKVDTATSDVLSGAVFAIATNEAGTIFLKKDGSSTPEITSLAGLTAVKADLLLATTGTDGKAVFSGLVCNDSTETTYRLVEIQAPTGYQLKEAAIEANLPEVTLGTNGLKAATKAVEIKNALNGTIDPDNPKFSLPLTGGAGTMFFTIIGILIMAATVAFYYGFKKKSNKVS